MINITQIQAQYIARMNKFQAMQQELKHCENSGDYAKTVKMYQQYIDFIRSWNNPNVLINGYISMAKYCERMEDRLMATDLFSEAINMMTQIGIEPAKIGAIQSKIESLQYY